MKGGFILGLVGAIVLHAGFLLFGKLLLPDQAEELSVLQQVELLSADDAAAEEKQKIEETVEERADELETEAEQAPDAEEMIRNLELAAVPSAPALEAASLSAIEAALSGLGGGGGDFAQSMDFASGGRIGGTGKAGPAAEVLESAFSLAEIDQKPRPIFQTAPAYPASMRGKKVEGVVTVVFVVDPSGKVTSPRMEKSTNVAFDKPALDAVKNWKFEPAVKAGQRVACKMRVDVRFKPS